MIMLSKGKKIGIVISMTTILTFPMTITGAGSNHWQSGAVLCSMSDAQFTALIQEAVGHMQAADAVGTRAEAQLLMELALVGEATRLGISWGCGRRKLVNPPIPARYCLVM